MSSSSFGISCKSCLAGFELWVSAQQCGTSSTGYTNFVKKMGSRDTLNFFVAMKVK